MKADQDGRPDDEMRVSPPKEPSFSRPATPRLDRVFEIASREGRKPLVIYLTASDPDFETSFRLVLAAADAGMDILELGVPWSDPSADGLAIQDAMERARKAGGGLASTLKLCAKLRDARPDLPIVLFGYANPFIINGEAAFARAAAKAGADAVLCVDWPADEDDALPAALAQEGVGFVPLLAPTSTQTRVEAAARVASGFIYYVSLTGITGAALTDFTKPRQQVESIRTKATVPVVVGFGIKTGEHARTVAAFADGVVVGSAAIKTIESAHAGGRAPEPSLASFVADLRHGMDTSSP